MCRMHTIKNKKYNIYNLNLPKLIMSTIEQNNFPRTRFSSYFFVCSLGEDIQKKYLMRKGCYLLIGAGA